jgi:hypothetical protein
MAAFHSYFAVSGADREAGNGPKSSAPILVVAGYFGHVDEWLSFQQEWKLLLGGKGLRCFDMAQFAKLEEPYASWTEMEREEFIQSLLAAIKRWAGVLIAWAIEIDDWQNKAQIVKAHTLCGLACIATVSDWAKECGYEEKISHTFEATEESLPAVIGSLGAAFRLPEDLDAYKIYLPHAQREGDLAPLQAARILAHQTGVARDKRRLDGDLAPYLDELRRTRGQIAILNPELLKWPEDVIRIADLEKSPLWRIPDPSRARAGITVTLTLGAPKSHTLRLPKRLDLMFAEREPKDNRPEL